MGEYFVKIRRLAGGGSAKRLPRVLPWLWLAAGYVFMLWYHIVPGAWIIDSDLAGEMLLAELLNREGGILCSNWIYTSELRVFHLQWFYRLGLLFFPQDWHAARVLAMALVLALLAAAFLFMARGAGLGSAAVWAAGALMWPCGFWYFFVGLYGGYYLLYMLFSFFTLGVLLRLRTGLPRRRLAGWLAAGTLAAAASGLNGVRQAMVLYVPLLAALAGLAILRVRRARPGTVREALRREPLAFLRLGAAALFLLGNAAGVLFNVAVLSRRYSYYTYGDMLWRGSVWGGAGPFRDVNLLAVWKDFLLQFGYASGRSLFTLGGLATGVGLLLGLAVLASLVFLCLRFGRLTDGEQLLTAFTLAALAVMGLVFTFLDVYNSCYWLPLVPFGFVALAVALKNGDFALRVTRPALKTVLALCVVFCSLATVRQELADPMRARPGLDAVADWLVDNGYTEGYAYFWSGQAAAELTDGRLEMWTLGPQDELTWMQPADHSTRTPQAPYFFLYDVGGYETVAPEDSPYVQSGAGELVYDDGAFQVWQFEQPLAELAAGQAG